jgi:plasmid stability protein
VVIRCCKEILVLTQDVTLHLPDSLYQRLKQRADQARHSVEDELIDVLATAVPVADELPPDLAEAVSSLATLDDESLWDAARNRVPVEAAEQLEQLHFKRQREGLTAAEADEAAALVQRYERVMLVRARAAAMLKQRGHDVSVLLTAA